MANIILPPSVYNKTPAPHLSARYVHVDSERVVAAMQEHGFQVASVKTGGARPGQQTRSAATTRHVIDFRHPDMPQLGDGVPRILFVNSHDGSTKASALAGVFRFVCSNGLVVGNTLYREQLRHTGTAAETLVERMQALARNTAPLFAQIERWTRKQLTAPQRQDFARMAAHLRWADAGRFDVEDLLQVRRPEDDRGDLWTVFNRVQEATTQAIGLTGITRSGRSTTARPLDAALPNLKYNAQLWELAEEFAQL